MASLHLFLFIVIVVVIIFIVIVVIALAAVGGLRLHQLYEQNASGESKLERAVSLIEGTDGLLDDLDAAVVDPFGEDAPELRASVEEGLQDALDDLEEADELARAASDELLDQEALEAANQAVVDAAARQELFELGESLVQTGDDAQLAVDSMEEAWNCLLSASDLTLEAAELVTDTTTENVESSETKTEDALEQLDLARGHLEAATEAFDIDVEAYSAYIDKREEALGHAIASDEALLEKDKETASSENEAYNTADGEAVALAEELPDDPSEPVAEEYELRAASLEDDYDAARSQVATADAFIRDYSGA